MSIRFLVTALLLSLLAATPVTPAGEVREALTPVPQTGPPMRPLGPERTLAEGAADVVVDTVSFSEKYMVLERPSPGGPYQARLYDSDHQVQGPPIPVGASGARQVAVEVIGENDWWVAWVEDPCDDCESVIYLQHFAGTYAPNPPKTVFTGRVSDFGKLILVYNDFNSVAVGWTVDNKVPSPAPDGANFSDVYARIYDLRGEPRGDAFRVNEDLHEEQNLNDAVWGGGDLVFVWESYEGEGYFYDVYRRHFDDTGVPLEGEVLVNDHQVDGAPVGRTGRQYQASIAEIGTGYVIAWTDWARPAEGDNHGGIMAKFYNGSGRPGPEWVVTDPGEDADHSHPSVAGDYLSSVVITWRAACGEEAATCAGPDGPDGSRGGFFGRSYSENPYYKPFIDSGIFTIPTDTRGEQWGRVLPAGRLGKYRAFYRSQAAGEEPRWVMREIRSGECQGLCLQRGRFEIAVHWRDFQGRRGSGQATPRDGDWGTFWFFRPANVELAVKVLDGRALTDHFWLFFASLSNVEYTVDAWDLKTGQVRRYRNPEGFFGSRGDTLALAGEAVEPWIGAASGLFSGPPQASASPSKSWSGAPVPVASAPAHTTWLPCPSSALCLHDDRFEVEIKWRDFQDRRGAGTGVAFSEDSAWFWFFRQGNPELLVKVLDGGPVNGHWWVFFGALSNVEFDLTVTDRATNRTATYFSPLDEFAARGDTTAFPGD